MPGKVNILRNCKGGRAKLVDTGKILTPNELADMIEEGARRGKRGVPHRAKILIAEMEKEKWKIDSSKPGKGPEKPSRLKLLIGRKSYMLAIKGEGKKLPTIVDIR